MKPKPVFARRSLVMGSVAVGVVASMRIGHKAVAQSTHDPSVAIELFTSQGCSSCPPADAVMGELARLPNIVALSFHVDYWNYIGWKDPFSSAQMTNRQRAYARALNQNGVYTPEMVVGGLGHTPGVYRDTLNSLIQQARRASTPRAAPILSIHDGGTLVISLFDHVLDTRSADVLLALYDREHQTPVARGENGGRTLKNINVVRRFEKVAAWDGRPVSLAVRDFRPESSQGVAVLVQQPDNGPIIGCSKLEQNHVT